MIKAVVLDWGGVMCPGGSPHSFRELLATSLGVDDDYARSLLHLGVVDLLLGEVTEDEYWHRLEQVHGKTIPETQRNAWLTWDDLKPNPHMVQLISDLKARGLKLGLLSNAVPNTRDIMLQHHSDDGFDAVVISCDDHCAKPDERAYLLISQKLGVEPSECVYIDDQQRMLDPASKLGMRIILAKNPAQTIEDINKQLS
ncbi:MAG TPA: HAD family phosphatase [Candidatus Saccharimonadia bacterium]|jgi:epoxide hydrolase-like predicted phosphatase